MKAPDKVNADLMKIREEAIQSRKQLDTLIITIDNYINHHDTDDMVITAIHPALYGSIPLPTALTVGSVMLRRAKPDGA